MQRQFVVQLDNRPGELAHLARALGARGIDISPHLLRGDGSLACAFMTTAEDDVTRSVLRGLGHEFIEGDDRSWSTSRTGRVAWPTSPSGSRQAGVNILGHPVRRPARRACSRWRSRSTTSDKARSALVAGRAGAAWADPAPGRECVPMASAVLAPELRVPADHRFLDEVSAASAGDPTRLERASSAAPAADPARPPPTWTTPRGCCSRWSGPGCA